MGTKKGRICGKGAPFKEAAPQRFAGGSYTKLPPPPGSATVALVQCSCNEAIWKLNYLHFYR